MNWLYIIFYLFIPFLGIAQKPFSVTVRLPQHIQANKITIRYDDGKKEFTIKKKPQNNHIKITGNFYDQHLVLSIEYQKSPKLGLVEYFFIDTKPAMILSDEKKAKELNADEAFRQFKVTNAVQVFSTPIALAFNKYAIKETNKYDSFTNRHNRELETNDSLQYIARQLLDSISYKQLDFITQHGNDYYSFWVFYSMLAYQLLDTTPELLLKTFETAFPEKFRGSVQGKRVLALINGRLRTKEGYEAPSFSTKDITGKILDLKKLRGKTVLLSFWATWCAPCMEKIPFLNQLQKKYPNDKFVIIGISADTDIQKFYAAIKQKNMNWLHIVNQPAIINLYGNHPLPSLYVLDKNGIIRYNIWEQGYDPVALEKIIDNLMAHL